MSRLIEFHLRLPFLCSLSHPHPYNLLHSLQQWHSRDLKLTILITPSPITSSKACVILLTAPPLIVQLNSPTPFNSALLHWYNGPIIITSDHASWNPITSSPSWHPTDEDATFPTPHGARTTHLEEISNHHCPGSPTILF